MSNDIERSKTAGEAEKAAREYAESVCKTVNGDFSCSPKFAIVDFLAGVNHCTPALQIMADCLINLVDGELKGVPFDGELYDRAMTIAGVYRTKEPHDPA